MSSLVRWILKKFREHPFSFLTVVVVSLIEGLSVAFLATAMISLGKVTAQLILVQVAAIIVTILALAMFVVIVQEGIRRFVRRLYRTGLPGISASNI